MERTVTRCARPGCYWRAEYTVDGQPACHAHAEADMRALTPGVALVIAALAPALQEIQA